MVPSKRTSAHSSRAAVLLAARCVPVWAVAWSFGYSYRRVGVQFVGNGNCGLGAGIGDRTPVKAGACDSVSEGPRAARRIRDIIDIP